MERRIYFPSRQRIILLEVGELAKFIPRFFVLAICPPSLSHYIYIIPLFPWDNKDAFESPGLGTFCLEVENGAVMHHSPDFMRRKKEVNRSCRGGPSSANSSLMTISP